MGLCALERPSEVLSPASRHSKYDYRTRESQWSLSSPTHPMSVVRLVRTRVPACLSLLFHVCGLGNATTLSRYGTGHHPTSQTNLATSIPSAWWGWRHTHRGMMLYRSHDRRQNPSILQFHSMSSTEIETSRDWMRAGPWGRPHSRRSRVGHCHQEIRCRLDNVFIALIAFRKRARTGLKTGPSSRA